MSDRLPDQQLAKPPVIGRCRLCAQVFRTAGDDMWSVVSPSGLEHIGQDYGKTVCGRDSTGDEWWWTM